MSERHRTKKKTSAAEDSTSKSKSKTRHHTKKLTTKADVDDNKDEKLVRPNPTGDEALDRQRIETYLQQLNSQLNYINDCNTQSVDHNQHILQEQEQRIQQLTSEYDQMFRELERMKHLNEHNKQYYQNQNIQQSRMPLQQMKQKRRNSRDRDLQNIQMLNKLSNAMNQGGPAVGFEELLGGSQQQQPNYDQNDSLDNYIQEEVQRQTMQQPPLQPQQQYQQYQQQFPTPNPYMMGHPPPQMQMYNNPYYYPPNNNQQFRGGPPMSMPMPPQQRPMGNPYMTPYQQQQMQQMKFMGNNLNQQMMHNMRIHDTEYESKNDRLIESIERQNQTLQSLAANLLRDGDDKIRHERVLLDQKLHQLENNQAFKGKQDMFYKDTPMGPASGQANLNPANQNISNQNGFFLNEEELERYMDKLLEKRLKERIAQREEEQSKQMQKSYAADHSTFNRMNQMTHPYTSQMNPMMMGMGGGMNPMMGMGMGGGMNPMMGMGGMMQPAGPMNNMMGMGPLQNMMGGMPPNYGGTRNPGGLNAMFQKGGAGGAGGMMGKDGRRLGTAESDEESEEDDDEEEGETKKDPRAEIRKKTSRLWRILIRRGVMMFISMWVDIKRRARLRKQNWYQTCNDVIYAASNQSIDWATAACSKAMQLLVTDTKLSLNVYAGGQKLTDKQADAKCKALLDTTKQIMNQLISATSEVNFPRDLAIFLLKFTKDGEYPPIGFLFDFEVNRCEFSSFASYKNMKEHPERRKMIAGLFLFLRTVIFKVVLRPQEKNSKIVITDLFKSNSKSLASIMYMVMLDYFQENVTIVHNNQAHLSPEDKIKARKDALIAQDGVVVPKPQKKDNDEQDLIVGLYDKQQFAAFTTGPRKMTHYHECSMLFECWVDSLWNAISLVGIEESKKPVSKVTFATNTLKPNPTIIQK